MQFDLLEFSKGGGCGCKLEPGKLSVLLNQIKQEKDPRILVDFSGNDDAAVLKLNDVQSLILTTDFFLPVVGNPYDFGKIAAANALSDVYAMGGTPLTALSILAWPQERIPLEIAAQVIEGAVSVCQSAGIVISGGHSIESADPIFGLSVTGIVNTEHIKRNNTPRVGDYIQITKPIGLGLLANALKSKKLSEEGYHYLLSFASKLNLEGIELAKIPTVSAMTDVTGFGLLGHLKEMLGNKCAAEIFLSEIPVFDEAKKHAMDMLYPNITTSNYNHVKDICKGLDGLEFLWLCDPQTGGGLMFTTSEPIEGFPIIGRVLSGEGIVVS
ncbi:MAG TPA: selenide, water dikinase SelD [Bacteroidia bacterium]